VSRSRVFLLFSVVGLAGEVGLADGIEAITKPSNDVTLSFVMAGRIAKVFVKEGDVVKVGQILVQQDDEAERARLAQLKAQAENTTRIKAAQAQLERKKEDLKRLQSAAKTEAATEFELNNAKLDVTIAELSHELARFQHEQDRLKYLEVGIQVSRMQLASPITGKVEQVFVERGESVDELEKVIRVVRIDPLWIDVPVPLSQARGLALGRRAVVEFPGRDRTVEGRIIHIAAVADAASNTVIVRVVVPNRQPRPAGEHVKVSFPVFEKQRPSREKPKPLKRAVKLPSKSQTRLIMRSSLWQQEKTQKLRTKSPSRNRPANRRASARSDWASMKET